MQGLFLEYKDPLFGLIVFVSLVFFIALLTYLANIYTTRYSNRHIVRFINSFNSTGSSDDLMTLITTAALPLGALELLARNYYNAGSFEETVEICLELLKRTKTAQAREAHLLLLAKSYYKAGFYKRAESSFVELLRHNPAQKEALNYLIIIYERLLRFKDAFDALLPLQEMGQDVALPLKYLASIEIVKAPKIALEEKASKLLSLYAQEPRLLRVVFMFLFRNVPAIAWEHLPYHRTLEVMDLLWNLPKEAVNLDTIAAYDFLKALYYAKGFYENFASCEVFELNLLNKLSPQEVRNTSLDFEYVCSTCKEITPLMNHRCPHCLGLLTLVPSWNIVKPSRHEAYYSF